MTHKVKPSRSPYPLEKWFDGDTHRLIRGRDFDCQYIFFYQSLWRSAKRMKLRLRFAKQGVDNEGNDIVEVQCLGRRRSK